MKIAFGYTKLKNLIFVLIFLFLCKCTNKYNSKNVKTLNEFKKSIKSSQILKNIDKDIPQIILDYYNETLTLEEIKQELNRNYESLINDDLSLISRLYQDYINTENTQEVYKELKRILKSQQYENNINKIVSSKKEYKTRLNNCYNIYNKISYESQKIITKKKQTKSMIEEYCHEIFSNIKQLLPQVLLNMIMKFYPFCYDYTILDKNDIELVSFKTLKKWNKKPDKRVFCEVEFYDINDIKFFIIFKNYRFFNSCFKGANLNFTNLTNANLTGADLTDVNLIHSDLTGANFNKANLTRADFSCANLTKANLTNVNLFHVNLIGANLTDADLTGTNLCIDYILGACMKNTKINYLEQITRILKSHFENTTLYTEFLYTEFILEEDHVINFLNKDFLISELNKIKKHDKNNFELIVKLLMEYFRNKLLYKKFNSSEVFIKEIQKFYNLKKITSSLNLIRDLYQSEIDKNFIEIRD